MLTNENDVKAGFEIIGETFLGDFFLGHSVEAVDGPFFLRFAGFGVDLDFFLLGSLLEEKRQIKAFSSILTIVVKDGLPFLSTLSSLV